MCFNQKMVEYNSTWASAEVFCQRCHRKRKGISLKNSEMSSFGLSLDLCANCIGEIASETEEFRI